MTFPSTHTHTHPHIHPHTLGDRCHSGHCQLMSGSVQGPSHGAIVLAHLLQVATGWVKAMKLERDRDQELAKSIK